MCQRCGSLLKGNHTSLATQAQTNPWTISSNAQYTAQHNKPTQGSSFSDHLQMLSVSLSTHPPFLSSKFISKSLGMYVRRLFRFSRTHGHAQHNALCFAQQARSCGGSLRIGHIHGYGPASANASMPGPGPPQSSSHSISPPTLICCWTPLAKSCHGVCMYDTVIGPFSECLPKFQSSSQSLPLALSCSLSPLTLSFSLFLSICLSVSLPECHASSASVRAWNGGPLTLRLPASHAMCLTFLLSPSRSATIFIMYTRYVYCSKS